MEMSAPNLRYALLSTADSSRMQETRQAALCRLAALSATPPVGHQAERDGEAAPDGGAVGLEAALAAMATKASEKSPINMNELRDLLRRATALVCRGKRDRCAIACYLVEIPFSIFTIESIGLGISLWLAVNKENPSMEARLLADIAENWEHTIRRRVGMFDPTLQSVSLCCDKHDH